MSFKITRRRNGRHETTVNIRFHVDANLAARIIANHGLTALTKREVEEVIRNALFNSGRDYWYYIHEDYEPADWQENITAAVDTVRRLWPEWDIDEEQ